MNGYSVTMRHEAFKRDGARGVVRHSIRSVEEKNGVYRNHSNERIDPSRTADNVVFVNDGRGGFVEAETTQQVHDHRESVLQKRADKQKLRKNQNVMMETLLQLDGEFSGTATEFLADSNGNADETRRLLDVLTNHIVDKVGQENVSYIALHVDETSPHVQIGWTPLAEDGSLDFRKILGETRYWKSSGRMRGTLTKQMLSDQHKEVRALLNEHGYPAVEVFSSPHHTKHEVFKRQQQQLDAAFAEREGEVKKREDDVALQERRVKRRKEELDTGKKQLKDDQEQLKNDREAFAKQQEEQQRVHNEEVTKAQRDLKKRKKYLDEKEAAGKKRLKQQLDNERATMRADVERREERVGEREQQQQKFSDAMNRFMNTKPFRDTEENIRGKTSMMGPQERFVEETLKLAEAIGVEHTPGAFLGASETPPQARESMKKGSVDTLPNPRTPNSAKKRELTIVEEVAAAREAKRRREAIQQQEPEEEQEAPDV